MAWKVNPNCQQCKKKLAPADKAAGRICSKCVAKNQGRIWGNDRDDDYTEGE